MAKNTTDVQSPMGGSGEATDTDDLLVWTVPQAGRMLGLGRNASYEAAARGDLPVIKIGKLKKVPKVAFARMLEQLSKEAS